jgi:predicted RNA methylase
MAVDYAQLAAELWQFYDFAGKTVLAVGAGGQLLDPASPATKLIAIDRDREALDKLRSKVDAAGRRASLEVVCASFEDVSLSGDVVYFEFCLHETSDPHRALTHARTLARDIVVFDHLPDSPWSFHAAEEEHVERANQAMERFGIRRRRSFSTEQRFSNHEELLAKIRVQGAVAIERAARFIGATNIVIPMKYALTLL